MSGDQTGNFWCGCGKPYKDEASWRCHSNASHRFVKDTINMLSGTVEKIPDLEFEQFADTKNRHPTLLGPVDDQKLRL